MKFNLVHVAIKVRPIYKCSKCGAEQAGTDTIEVSSMDELDRLKWKHAKAYGIPVGWGSYGPPDYRCAKCLG